MAHQNQLSLLDVDQLAVELDSPVAYEHKGHAPDHLDHVGWQLSCMVAIRSRFRVGARPGVVGRPLQAFVPNDDTGAVCARSGDNDIL